MSNHILRAVHLGLVTVTTLLANLSGAKAGELLSLTCGNTTSPTALQLVIKTGEFTPSNQKILQYDVTFSSKRVQLESNMKVFDSDSQALSFIETNPVVIPLTGSVIILNAGKKSATWIDTVYEKIEELTCTK